MVKYLNQHGPDRIVAAHNFLQKFFKDFVPRFADVLIISNDNGSRELKRAYKTKEVEYSYEIISYPMYKNRAGYGPDMVWIDDISIPWANVLNIARYYNRVPLLHSGRKFRPTEIKLIVDTREQLPIWKGLECKRMALNVGDYTTEPLLDKFHIERKSPQDLYGSIIQNHVRFVNELIRARARGIHLIVYVESTRENFLRLSAKQRKMKWETLDKITTTMEMQHGPFVWCLSREDCKLQILKRLKKEQKKLLL